MKKSILGFVAAGALIAGPAMAADLSLPVKAPYAPPPAASWTGCDINGGVGYGMYNTDSFSENSTTLVPIGTSVTNGGRGWLGRVGGGCDYQFGVGSLGNFVAGAFADYDFMNLSGTFGDPSGPVTGAENERGAWYAGGRLGYLVTPSLLTYVDGGYTQTNFSSINFLTPLAHAVPTDLALAAHTYNGWFIGGGAEYALNMPWLPIRGLFWRLEYRFSQYQSADVPILLTVPPGGPFGVSEHVSPYVETITSSLVWRFNFGGPLAMRY